MPTLKVDTPHMKAKIALAREYGDKVKELSLDFNEKFDRSWRHYLTKIRKDIASGKDTKDTLDDLFSTSRTLLAGLLSGCVRLICEREHEDYDRYGALLSSSVEQCGIGYYEDSLNRYREIVSEEIQFAVNDGKYYDISLFLLNPLGYMSDRKNGVSALKEGIQEVGKGVSYSLADNMKRLGISAAALAYSFGLLELWKSKGGIEGYFGVRNSTFPCSLCDSHAYEFIPLSGGMIYPLHNRCVCSIVPVTQSELS